MDKITISRNQFNRAFNNSNLSCSHDLSPELVAESQKPELIERWAVVHIQSGNCMYYSGVKEDAEKWLDTRSGYRIVHLREVVGV